MTVDEGYKQVLLMLLETRTVTFALRKYPNHLVSFLFSYYGKKTLDNKKKEKLPCFPFFCAN